MREHRLFAKRKKCSSGDNQVEYLGHMVLAAGISSDTAKIAAVADWIAL